MPLQALYYTAKGEALKVGGDPKGGHRDELATLEATLIAHRMAAKAGVRWDGPEAPKKLRDAGRLVANGPSGCER